MSLARLGGVAWLLSLAGWMVVLLRHHRLRARGVVRSRLVPIGILARGEPFDRLLVVAVLILTALAIAGTAADPSLQHA